MRITGVESTDLFTGSVGRPLQVVRVTVEATDAGEAGAAVAVRVVGGGETTGPFDIILAGPGESRSGEVSVAVTGSPGRSLPVTVICETGGARVTEDATITVAEPGWTMWMVSHFHYDPVWWTTQGQFTEARLVLPDEDGKLPDVRTAFELVRLHLEKARRDADYKFVLAEVDYLKPHFDAFPADRGELRRLMRDGRVELVGGTYNEPNTNLTGAETTIRNAVYGMGFQRGVLGGEPASAWMLDAFGFDPGFPGLMAAAGLTSSSWARGPFHQWGPAENERMQFPAEFEWLSPDGSGLLTAYMANHYGAGWTLHTASDLEAALAAAYSQFQSLAPVAATRNVMLPVGSDHVIPARWVTDVAREWAARYVWPRFVPALPREFFAAVRADAEESPSRHWIMPQTRDMNPLYTGKDVSYADTKLAARAGETAVLDGERLATLAWLRGAPYPAESLDKAWRQLAYGAHHDAITGTESDQVYLDLLAGWREAWQRGDEARRSAIAFLADGGTGGTAVTVANGLARERDGMATVTVRVPARGVGWLDVVDPASGEDLPALAEGVRRHDDGSLAEVTLTFLARGVPALGFWRYPLRATSGPGAGSGTDGSARVAGWADIAGTAIENDAFAVTADPARGGSLGRVVDKRSWRDVLAGPGNDLVLQEEYEQHPRWNEGPWHLTPTGPGIASSAAPASSVRAQRSPVGSRLVATYPLGDLTVTAETILWDGAERVEFRTKVSGSIGKDHLLRVRFPAVAPGGLPVYQTATAVIGRPFGAPEADVAEHWWTLDNPANHWFGLGSVARVVLTAPDGGAAAAQAIGVAEVITPNILPNDRRRCVKDLVVSLAGAGVTATTSRATGPRYGSIDVDSNLPDFRIALGGPADNSFTAEVLAACDPAVAKRLAALLADGGTARFWVPATRSRAEAFAPDTDLRGPRDLPVLILAPHDPAELEMAIGELTAGLLADATIDMVELAPEGGQADRSSAPPDPLDQGAVAVFNRGTPGAAVTPDGTLWMSLFRACSSWPSGVWIDGDRQAAPDGSSFAWQHWSHTFGYALASSGAAAGWREAGFNAAAEAYNHDLVAVVSDVSDVSDISDLSDISEMSGGGGGLLISGAPNVTLSALKPFGNPLAAGLPGSPADRLVTVRLRETDGRAAIAQVRMAGGIEAAWRTDLIEETEGAPLTVAGGAASVRLAPFETVTLVVKPAAAEAAAEAAALPEPVAAVTPADAAALPEPAQPVYARYWLHGKGPAPAGNVPVAVHFTPTRVTLMADAAADVSAAETGSAAGDGDVLTLTVACGPRPASGEVELVVPDGLTVTISGLPGESLPGAPTAGEAAAGGVTAGRATAGRASAGGVTAGAASAGVIARYDLDAGEFAAWNVAVSTLPETADGRYFVAARITDGAGQVLEDTALVTVGEAGGPDAGLEPEELFFRLQSDVAALEGEADLAVLTPALRLAPGESGALTVRVASHLESQLRGEAQLVSPIGTWRASRPWTQAVEVAPGGEATVAFDVTVPATATPGWESWLLVKLMYFGRIRYSPAIKLTVG